MKRLQSRSGAAEASIMIVLAVLLAIAAFGTLLRGQETSHHAARLELRAQLSTALESSLEEAWWAVDRAVPASAKSTPRKNARVNPLKALRSQILAGLCARTASP